MESKLLNIIRHSDLLSQEEIIAYSNKGDLSNEEIYAIEFKISNNPANQELLDVYREQPELFEDTETSVHLLNNNSIEWLLVFSSLILMTIFSVYFVAKEHRTVTLDFDQDTEFKAVTETQNYIKMPISDSKHATEVTNKPAQVVQKKDIPKRETLSIEKLESGKIDPIDLEEIREYALKNKNKYPAVYLGDFKVTDYSKIRTFENKKAINLGGTPANSENQERASSFERLKVDSVYYMAFLRGLLRGFGNRKYKLIIPKLEDILKVYPEDDNALFYRAVSLYYLSEHRKSIENLQAVLSDPMSNFKEEAKWHLALNFKALNEQKEAQSTLLEIIEEKGFYAQRARNLVKNINE